MKDEELKALLKTIDEKFDAIVPLLQQAGEALEEKAERERGVKLGYQIGWKEGGMECLCLTGSPLWPKGKEIIRFRTWSEQCEWEEKSATPLFDGLKHLYFETLCACDSYD